MSVCIIVVSYNTRDLLRKCLAAIPDACAGMDYSAWVIDNNSPDRSAEMVAAEFHHIKLTASPDNLGFAAANNLAIAQSDDEYVVLLNPDTEAEPKSLTRLVQYLAEHKDAGACGPMLLNTDLSLQKNGTRFPNLWGDILALTGLRKLCGGYWNRRFGNGRTDFDLTCEVDWVSGACIAVKREVIERVGPLDSRFFMFYEEVEWCHRIRRAGWKVYYVAESRVVHHWMGSVKQSPKKMTDQLFKSQPLYYHMTSGPLAAGAARVIMTVGMLKNSIRYVGVAIKGQMRRARLIRQPRP